jgi:lipoate-protein ligase A
VTAEVLARWQSAAWSVLPEEEHSPPTHVAIDEALMESVRAGRRGPTLRFWAWASPAVIIGRFQSLRNEVDADAASQLGVTVVRRVSGGGAMYVRPGWTVTYSIYVPESMLEGMSIRDSYSFCDAWVVDGLRGLGADVTYVPLNDIASPAGKVGGAAQARRPGVVLHHTTIAYKMDGAEMLRVLRIGREKLSDKGIPSAAKRVHPLVEQVPQSREEVVAHLVTSFRARFPSRDDVISEGERDHAAELLTSKYGTPGWTADLP